MRLAPIVLALALVSPTWAPQAAPPGQEPGRAVGRTEKGLYLLKVVEPGYDVTIRETERGPAFSVLDVNGLVPTVTAGGTVVFSADYSPEAQQLFDLRGYLSAAQMAMLFGGK